MRTGVYLLLDWESEIYCIGTGIQTLGKIKLKRDFYFSAVSNSII